MSLGSCDRTLPCGAPASSGVSRDDAAALLRSALSLRVHVRAAFFSQDRVAAMVGIQGSPEYL